MGADGIVVGSHSVFDDEETLIKYSHDQSFVEPRRPEVVAFAKSVEDVQEVIRYANKIHTPVVPFSSGLNLHGGTIPKEGGILLDLSQMNAIQVDDNNWLQRFRLDRF